MEKVAFRSGINHSYTIKFNTITEYLHPELPNIVLGNASHDIYDDIPVNSSGELSLLFLQIIHKMLSHNTIFYKHFMSVDNVKFRVKFKRIADNSYDTEKIINILQQTFSKFNDLSFETNKAIKFVSLTINNFMNRSKEEIIVITTIFSHIIYEASKKKYIRVYTDKELNAITSGLYNKVINDANTHSYKTLYEQFKISYKPLIDTIMPDKYKTFFEKKLEGMHVLLKNYSTLDKDMNKVFGLYDNRFSSEYFHSPNGIFEKDVECYYYTSDMEKRSTIVHRDFGFFISDDILSEEYLDCLVDAIKRTNDETLEFHRKLDNGVLDLPFMPEEIKTKRYMLYNLYQYKKMNSL